MSEAKYLVIGYYNGKSIVRDRDNHLFFIRCEESEAPEGSVPSDMKLQDVSRLDIREQKEIYQIFE